MTDTTQPPSETQQEVQAYYAKLDEYKSQAQLRTSIGYPNSNKADKELLFKYLTFRGWKLQKNISFNHLALLLLEQDAKDEQVRCGLSLMLWDEKRHD